MIINGQNLLIKLILKGLQKMTFIKHHASQTLYVKAWDMARRKEKVGICQKCHITSLFLVRKEGTIIMRVEP